jgi:phenylpropionate dioxygenase-like ring-hydroxylating dioxygenase large terminal subunit
MTVSIPAIDPIVWNDWHPVAARCTLDPARAHATMLLTVSITVAIDAMGTITVRRDDGAALHHDERYGLVWVCLGTPTRPVLPIPEADEPDRPAIVVGAVGVRAAAPRVIENFLDLSHLGYVHAGYLGDDPHTQVLPYKVDPLPGGGIIATGCRMFQPQASPAATEGFMVDYVYKVERPLATCLHKANPVHRDRYDVIYLFVQPVTEDSSIAHPLLLCLPDGTTPEALRAFQQTIFLQDKPILENQVPKRLPLADRAELPIAADKSSIAYRRWLASIGLTWGVIPAPSKAIAA